MHTLTSEQKGVACVCKYFCDPLSVKKVVISHFVHAVSCADKVSTVVSDFFTDVDELGNHWTCTTALTAACSLYITLKDEPKSQNYGEY